MWKKTDAAYERETVTQLQTEEDRFEANLISYGGDSPPAGSTAGTASGTTGAGAGTTGAGASGASGASGATGTTGAAGAFMVWYFD